MIPIDSLPINIAIYRYENGNFIFVDFNRQAEKTDNIKREDLVGKNLEKVFPGVRAFGFLDVLERVYTTGEPEHFEAGYYKDEIREGWRVNDVSRLDNGHIMAVYKDVTQEVQNKYSLESLGNLIDKNLNEIYIFHPETLTFCYANGSALHNIGYTIEELSRMTPPDIKPEYSIEKFRKLIQPLRDGIIPLLSIETKHRRKDGTEYDVEARIQKMLYLGKEHFVVNIIDITDRIRDQQEMLKLHRIIEQSDDLIMITDSNGVIEYINNAYVNLTGWKKEKFIKAKPSFFKSGMHSDMFYKEIWKIILSGKTYKGIIQNRKKDGSLYWEEKTITPIKLTGETITHFISTGKDITEQIKLKEALEENELLFRTLTESALAGIFLYRETFLYANEAFVKMTGYSLNDLKKMTAMELVAPQEQAFIQERVSARLKGELQDQIVYQDLKMVTRTGEVRWLYITISTVKFRGEWTGLGTAMDMTERKEMEKKLEYVAQTDALTGLYNRLRFDDIVQREIAFGKRQDTPLSVIYMDIDFFKKINDTCGHDVGDIILKEIAFIIRDILRASDYPFRWGGEEFIILCPSTTLQEIKVLAERLRERIAENNFSVYTKVTVSIGLTQYHNDESVDEMIKRADLALYQAKENGRNRSIYGS
ncbi:diguanylate cyclase with PAS/PAC sensor (plasmid) [Sulfuricurvum kujiense DSM 16994]|uniref:Diguanylate cyclase with PAS/PAC sensor n=1 Tax=Sulfuricurvum kujiense (strain ATCC BAA-921 / DSM 16994 / JCM 11577 / YK-1) TaxID=709032 RepID=E4U3V9_SULKY|nr:PAS domain S-box protein [Sulfuricurvum kujiense]ADR35375.1 diguanylate cyclase with PAS/PAC sensor [Sulfuricurvum kujiense DSM 16994]